MKRFLMYTICVCVVLIGMSSASAAEKYLQAQYFGVLFDGEYPASQDNPANQANSLAVWNNLWTTPPPFEKVDILVIAFAHTVKDKSGKYVLGFRSQLSNGQETLVNPDGATRLSYVVSQARNANPNVKILISLGWGLDYDVTGTAADPEYYAQSVIDFINQYNLDGLDLDWETKGSGVTQNQATALYKALSDNLHENGKIFTYAPCFSLSEAFLTSQNVGYFDYIFPQTYGQLYPKQVKTLGYPSNKMLFGMDNEDDKQGQDIHDPVYCVNQAKQQGLAGVFNWRMDKNDGNDNGYTTVNTLNTLLNK